ncbi:MAG: insulinase family protein [Moheibacter sp.]
MIKRLTLFGCLVLSVSLTAQFKTVQKKDANGYNYEMVENDPSNTRIYTLNNGLKVFLAQNRDEPRIQTYIPVRTGSNNDPEDNTGLAHYLEHMLFKGTSKIGSYNWEQEKVLLEQISDLYEKHKLEQDPDKKVAIYKQIDSVSYIASQYAVANEYDKMISSLGATGTNAHTWFDETVYKNNIPSNELEKWMYIESERFSELTLRLFHTELEAVYEEFNRAQDNDFRLIHYALMKNLFPTSHYGTQTTIGTSEHLKNPSMVAITNYYNEYYVPNNMAVVLVGDFEFEPTIKMVDKYFGFYKKAAEPDHYVAHEPNLKGIKTVNVSSPSAERFQFAYRVGGSKTKDALLVQVMDMILSNRTAGLIDLNINQKQLAQSAGSNTQIMKDYTAHIFSGAPKKGQSMDEVKDLLLQQIEKIKTGDFDEWMITAVVNDLKKQWQSVLENSNALATTMYDSFIQERSWQQTISELDEMSKITKADLMKFANDNYGDNYVIVYKNQGENKDLVRVENPGITPISLNRENESQFYKDFQKMTEKPILPVFVDFDKSIKTETLKGSKFSSIQNVTNDLSTVYYITEIGADNDKKLPLAMNYLNYLGTSKYSPEDLKKEFYKIGIDFGVNAGSERSFVSIRGLQENLDEGIKLFEHLMADAKADKEAYQNYVDKIIKSRNDAKVQKNSIQNALNQYAMYGPDNRFRDQLSEAELRAIDPAELVQILKEFLNYQHQIFYYGKDASATKKALEKYHNFGNGKKIPAAKVYPQPMTDGRIFFAPYDMVQAEISLRAREEKFDKNLLTPSGVFNEYFGSGLSSIVFQEIRESKSLAYSAYSVYANSDRHDKYNYVIAYVGTQANKLPQAVDALKELMNDMPKAENQFNNSKNAALKKIATRRYTKSGIFFYQLDLKDRGIDYDINKDIYSATEKMTMKDLENFFNSHIKGKHFNVGLIGKKDNLDWEAVQSMGDVKELTLEELFGY